MADAGLIGDDDDRSALFLDPEPRQVEDAGNELELVGAMDVAVIEIDHAVTVEKMRRGACLGSRVISER